MAKLHNKIKKINHYINFRFLESIIPLFIFSFFVSRPNCNNFQANATKKFTLQKRPQTKFEQHDN